MPLAFTGVAVAGQSSLETDIRSVLPLQSGLVASLTGANGGLALFSVSGAGQAAFVDSQMFGGQPLSQISKDLGYLTVSGQTVLLTGQDQAGQIVGYEVSQTGVIGSQVALTLSHTPAARAVLNRSGPDLLVAIESGSGALASYFANDSGGVTAAGRLGTDHDPDSALLRMYETANGPVALVADAYVQGVSSYTVDATSGALVAAGRIGLQEGLGANQPTDMEVVEAFGQTWVILTASQSNSVSVLALGPDGALTLVDHQVDTSRTRFEGAQSVTSFEAGGQRFVLIGGSDGGVSLFSLLPGGHLAHLGSLEHQLGYGLDRITDMAVTVLPGSAEFLIASQGASGLAQFSLSLGDLGVTSAVGGPVDGSAGDDLVYGVGRIAGLAGADLLYAGDADTVLDGGPGEDRIVLRPSPVTYTIDNFEAGTDILDLSLFPLLRSAAQLNYAATSYGGKIVFGGTTVDIRNALGTALDIDDIWPAGFDWSDRYVYPSGADSQPWPEIGAPQTPLYLPEEPDRPVTHPTLSAFPAAPAYAPTYQGAHTGETIKGGVKTNDYHLLGNGADNLWNRGGNNYASGGKGDDTISANGGNDTLVGGAGNDSLKGNGGEDHLSGGGGRDTVWGGTGNDYVAGDGGKDRIGGAEGDDTHSGGAGDDIIYGGQGRDLGFGDADNDEVWMSTEDDTVYGGDGDDSLGGGHNNDLLFGEAGDDLLYGGYDHDTLYGGAGDDVIWPGPGNDFTYGDDGNDTVGGGDGHDLVRGGAGDDQVWGGAGNDFLFGDAGNDMLDGEAGRDVFVFAAGHGSDTISRFSVADDFIYLDAPGLSHDNLSIQYLGADALVTSPLGQILLEGIGTDALVDDVFYFA